jgi:MraZ protein
MAKFIGEYGVKIDDKGRIIFPSQLKNVFPQGETLKFVVKKDLFEDCLQMFTYEEWEKESEKVKERLNFFNRKHAEFWREYMRDRSIVEPDGKLGRISLPKRLLAQIGADKEVIFSGNDHLIEIWSKEKFEARKMSQSEFVSLAEDLLG